MVNNLPAVHELQEAQETQVRSLGGEDLPEEDIAIHSSILLYIYIYIKLKSVLRRQWQPTPVLLPGKSHGRRSLVGCSPWGHEESDMTEAT